MTTQQEEDILALVQRMDPEAKRLWVEALRSGEYAQGRNYLAEMWAGNWRYCCLGVLCEVATEQGVPVTVVTRPGSQLKTYSENSTIPPTSVAQWAWAEETRYPALRIPHVDEDGVMAFRDFTELNDDMGLSFEQIADLIEEYL
jgi:hypothetical protein